MKNQPKTKISLWCLLSAMLLTGSNATRADAPLPAPANHKILSRNGKFAAEFDWKAKKTTIYARKNATRQAKLWQMNGWHLNAFLADNGRNLIVFHAGANLLNLNYQPDDVMIKFYDRGTLLRQVRLNQIIANPTPDKFRRTVSHYNWLESYGLEGDKFIINTLQKKRLVFDIKTGKSLRK